jgi:hypothetical protein
LRDARIEDSARGALAVFGASVQYEGTLLRCQSFDVIAEAYDRRAYVIENLGNNGCGCPEANGACILESPGLAPPDSIAE